MSLRDVQALCKSLGHDPGPLDGIYGLRTERAIIAALSGPAVDIETDLLMAELERDEGCVLHAYRDSLGYTTIGIGRLIDKHRGGGITREEAEMLKRNDIDRVRAELDARLPWWRGLNAVRQRAVQNMGFQLGINGLLGFTASLRLIQAGDYRSAASNLRASLWARQTPARADRVIRMIETGTV